MLVVSAITWLFVTTRPDDEMTIPVPAAEPPESSVVVMLTMESSRVLAIDPESRPPPTELLDCPPVGGAKGWAALRAGGRDRASWARFTA